MQELAARAGSEIAPPPSTSRRRFAPFAWGVLAYNVIVILWGALVRATGSGAGCGGHWPLCNGEVLPRIAANATVIEFTHRLMSGLALAAVVAQFAWARAIYPRGNATRRWAMWSVVFILTEALLIGAMIMQYGSAFATDSLFAVILTILVVAMFAMKLVQMLDRRLTGWKVEVAVE